MLNGGRIEATYNTGHTQVVTRFNTYSWEINTSIMQNLQADGEMERGILMMSQVDSCFPQPQKIKSHTFSFHQRIGFACELHIGKERRQHLNSFLPLLLLDITPSQ